MNAVKCILFMLLIKMAVLSPPLLGQQSSLFVGEKVIFGGGPDQPPKEKDTGLSLKVNSVLISAPGESTEETEAEPEELDDLLENGEAEKVLLLVSKRTDLIGKTYRVLALSKIGRKAEAESQARVLLSSNKLPDEMREKIEDILELPNQ